MLHTNDCHLAILTLDAISNFAASIGVQWIRLQSKSLDHNKEDYTKSGLTKVRLFLCRSFAFSNSPCFQFFPCPTANFPCANLHGV